MIGDPVITVYCDTDNCGYTEEFGLTATARSGYDERNLKGEMKNSGWKEISENVHMCPQCVEEERNRILDEEENRQWWEEFEI